MLFGSFRNHMAKMKLSAIAAAALAAALSAGCAAQQATDGSNVAQSATGNNAGNAANAAGNSQESDDVQKHAGIARECRGDIADIMRNADGTIGVLSADKTIRKIASDGTSAVLGTLSGDISEYSLMPFSNIIIRRSGGKIMVEDIATGLELFKLQGDASIPKVWYAQDFEELAIQTTQGRYNIWKTKERFSGVSTGETVQDFLNRQSPDHSLAYPGTLRAMALGKNGNVAVALDDPTAGKVGLIYRLDTINAPGTLAVQARTNTPVSVVAISPSSNYIAAADENGDFYFMNTVEKKGFIAFAKLYKNVRDVVFWGDNPVVLQDNRTAVIDAKTGAAVSEIDERFDRCIVADDNLLCIGDGWLSVISAANGKTLKRYAFSGDKYAVVDVAENSVSGSLANDNCM